ncbi:hypothetical protein BKI52_31330 [marine bacterium AO1-C]|nr:hypothetical protein BKI52_31330 [marine bacterium AO1-C]
MISKFAFSQVNGYAKVTNISDQTLTLSNVDETFDTFEAGEQVIIIQIQDDVIGANTNNDANFGNLDAIASAGLYELATILSINEIVGVPITINLTSAPSRTYNTGSNSSVQIVTFPQLGSPNFTTTADITSLSWDGNVGGVLAFQVTGTLTLNHNISANGVGFRGGNANGNTTLPAGCDNSVFITNTNSTGEKGEGIYKSTNTLHDFGRAKILNAGGGGSFLDAGGGGGGNFSEGGEGGWGFNCGAAGAAGGLGGIDLSAHITGGRVFMGGGGGGGQINFGGIGGNGSNGGGIVFVRAGSLVTTGTCGGRTISANGGGATNGVSNGGGGAGAGGTVVLEVTTFIIDAGCPLTVEANGGDGGNADGILIRGGGGGGGQGAVIYSSTQPTSNVTTTTTPGDAGFDNSIGSQSAGNGGGVDGQGVQDNQNTGLPVELLYFIAEANQSNVLLRWATIQEINNKHFIIQRSRDLKSWTSIDIVKGRGNYKGLLYYQALDQLPGDGLFYYRLKQVDFDGTSAYSSIEGVSIKVINAQLLVFPNPIVEQSFQVQLRGVSGQVHLKVVDMVGKTIWKEENTLKDGAYLLRKITTSDWPAGIYILKVSTNTQTWQQRIVVK